MASHNNTAKLKQFLVRIGSCLFTKIINHCLPSYVNTGPMSVNGPTNILE